jgi:hypothetical protein
MTISEIPCIHEHCVYQRGHDTNAGVDVVLVNWFNAGGLIVAHFARESQSLK